MYGIFYTDAQKALTSKQSDGTKFRYTAFYITVQCLGNALFSIVMHFLTVHVMGICTVEEESRRGGKARAVVPFFNVLLSQDAAGVAFTYVFAMYTSNKALDFVSFPFQVLAKSCKMIPVLLGSMYFLGKKYSLAKYLSVAIMTLGVGMFFWFEKKGDKGGKGGAHGGADTSLMGIALITASLAFDGASGPMQEGMKKYVLTAFQQNLVSNVWAVLYMSALVLGFNEFFPAVSSVCVCVCVVTTYPP